MSHPKNIHAVTSDYVKTFIKDNKFDKSNLTNYSLYLILCDMGIKTIDSTLICPAFIEESNFLQNEENCISFEEGRFELNTLTHIISSPIIQPHNARKLQSVVNALENLISKNMPITKQEY